MSSAPPPPMGPDEIVNDAGWLVQALDADNGLVRVVRMDADAYRNASFLDDRMLQDQHFAGIVPWDSVAAAIPSHARG